MPTIFSHAIFASALGAIFQSANAKKSPALFWILTAVCAMLPDLDVVGFAFGIPYGSIFGHRGFTHSLLFSMITGLAVAILFSSTLQISKWKTALFFGEVTFSHPVLDMLTNGGLGVALFAPVSHQRFFFPWRLIEVSPIGPEFFSERGTSVIASEVLWILVPSILTVLASCLIRRTLIKDPG
jgi:inner membrane protein